MKMIISLIVAVIATFVISEHVIGSFTANHHGATIAVGVVVFIGMIPVFGTAKQQRRRTIPMTSSSNRHVVIARIMNTREMRARTIPFTPNPKLDERFVVEFKEDTSKEKPIWTMV